MASFFSTKVLLSRNLLLPGGLAPSRVQGLPCKSSSVDASAFGCHAVILWCTCARELANTMDMTATIADFEQIKPPNPLDGKSIRQILLNENAKSPHDFMFHYCGMNTHLILYEHYQCIGNTT